jgi:peptidoglycan-associated lipoprotein
MTDVIDDASQRRSVPRDESQDIFARKSLEQLNAERPLADAFLDFDQYAIRDDARRTLQQNAGWLRRWESTRITVEGHGDERGTSEYNLALGERRANAAKEYLVDVGVAPGRIPERTDPLVQFLAHAFFYGCPVGWALARLRRTNMAAQ